MKKFWCTTLLLVILASILLGCTIPGERPEDGIWYCEELGIYLNMKNSQGTYLDTDGEYSPLFIQIDYGTGLFINYCEKSVYDPNDCKTLRTDYEYKDGILRLDDRDSDRVYEFVEVDAEQYPGG